jgi:biotin synthase-related radical SAM superfamily protein
MGLDSWVYSVDLENVIDDFSFEKEGEAITSQEIAYWRKHNVLHTWMKKLFIKKGGDISVDQFNCDYIRLTLKDIENLENDADWIDEDPSHEEDLKFINEAKLILQEGNKALYFTSWY